MGRRLVQRRMNLEVSGYDFMTHTMVSNKKNTMTLTESVGHELSRKDSGRIRKARARGS